MLMSRKSIRSAKNSLSKEERKRQKQKYPSNSSCRKQISKKKSGKKDPKKAGDDFHLLFTFLKN